MSIYMPFVALINLCIDNLIGTKLSRSNDMPALTAQLFTSILYIQKKYPLLSLACHVSRFTVQCFYTVYFFFSMFHWRLNGKLLNIKRFVIFRRICFNRIVVTVSIPFRWIETIFGISTLTLFRSIVSTVVCIWILFESLMIVFIVSCVSLSYFSLDPPTLNFIH